MRKRRTDERQQTGAHLRLAMGVVFLAALMGPLAAPLAQAEGAGLASHRAAYIFKLGKAEPGSDISSVDGAMRVAMERSCDGWVMGQDVNMVLGTSEGEGVVNRVRFAALESFDGLTYDFVVRSRTGDMAEAIRGQATLPSRDKAGEVAFKEPIVEPIALPKGTLFPVAHLAHLIERAQAGASYVQAPTFDGTEVAGAQRAVAFIGGVRAPEKAVVDKLGPLADQRGWTMRIAYFQDSAADGVPDVEVELYQLENGVTPRLLLDYGSFTTEVEAVSLEAVPDPNCS